jgi:hypothetical protein
MHLGFLATIGALQMAQVNVVFSHCRLLRMVEADVSVMFFDPYLS